MSVTLNLAQGVAEFLLTTQGSTKFGWLGIGIGDSMSNADIVVVWPNPDGSTTISRRLPAPHTLPQPNPNQSAVKLLPVSNPVRGADGSFSARFTRPLVLAESSLKTTTTGFIWACSTQSPSGSNLDATFVKHDNSGLWKFDLSKPLSTSSPRSIPYDTFVYAHASVMFVAWAISMPIALIIAIFFRSLPNWVRIHWGIQVFATTLLTIAGVVLGKIMHADKPANLHTIYAIPLLSAFLAQALLGGLIHYLYDPNRTRRPIRNWIHRGFGLLVFLAGLVQIPLGIMTYTLDDRPFYAYVGWLALLLAVFIGLGVRAFVRNRKKKYDHVNLDQAQMSNIHGVWATEEEEEGDAFAPQGRAMK